MPTFTPPPPTAPSSSQFSADHLTVVLASISSLMFFVVIVVLLSVLYQKDPLCCKVRFYQDSRPSAEALPQHYSSNQTLVTPPCREYRSEVAYDNMVAQPGQLFLVGQESSYQLPPLDAPLPYLPSYESVRKKDRQRQVHVMIADRFGLNNPVLAESPPTYEESVHQAFESHSFEAADATQSQLVHSRPDVSSAELRDMVTQQHGDSTTEVHLPV
ncbi:hypothetical protein GN956_G8998 [Arapaima gigas]